MGNLSRGKRSSKGTVLPTDFLSSNLLRWIPVFNRLVSWCFEPSQPERAISWLKTNFNFSPSYSAHKSQNHKIPSNYSNPLWKPSRKITTVYLIHYRVHQYRSAKSTVFPDGHFETVNLRSFPQNISFLFQLSQTFNQNLFDRDKSMTCTTDSGLFLQLFFCFVLGCVCVVFFSKIEDCMK